MRRALISLAVVGTLIGIPALVLQRWVAETRFAAIVLVLAWFAVVGIALVAYVWRRPGLRLPVLGAFAAILAGTVAIGYVTGFRDMVVDEDVAMAATVVPAAERERSLSGAAPAGRPRQPVELARGSFTGEDGHAGTGKATVVAQPGGQRLLTFTGFDVDPGVDVDVYLSADPGGIDEAVKIDDLKGNVGDQQYEIPASLDLRRYSNVVLWCNPFTVRIAVAELGV
jgi:electron transfer DM13